MQSTCFKNNKKYMMMQSDLLQNVSQV